MEARLRFSAAGLELDVAFVLGAPWSVLFAPSGAGKSTVLRMIAGLQRPQAGRIAIVAGEGPEQTASVLYDSEARVFVPPYRRGIGFVAQDPALFPHMSVLRNVVFGAARKPAGVEAIMGMCRVAHLGAKMPRQISGGERQRVALARAIAAGPGLLLLDEPFTGMDGGLRDGLAAELRVWLERSGTPVLQVTHDLGDVLATGAEVLKMDGGRIVGQGPAELVLAPELERLRQQLSRAGVVRPDRCD